MSEKFDAAFADTQKRKARGGLLGRMGVEPYSLIWWIVALPFMAAMFAVTYLMMTAIFG